jgi:hypothetical protein
MHNIDRTNLESTYGEYPQEYSGEYVNEYPQEYSGEYAGEYPQEYSGEYAGEYAQGYPGEYAAEYPQEYSGEYLGEDEGEYTGESGEYPGEFGQELETYGEYSQEGTFSEAEEMELAAELLSVTNEEELEQFLGKLFKKAAGFIKSPIGQQLISKVKGLAKKALPILGSTLGNVIAPGVGGVIGGKIASATSGMFGLELEGLSYEDQEFEVAKQIVRLGSAAAVNAAQAPPSVPPEDAARQGLMIAARQYAPGMLRPNGAQYGNSQGGGTRYGGVQFSGPQYGGLRYGGPQHGRRHRCSHQNTGRWIRRGNQILLLQA